MSRVRANHCNTIIAAVANLSTAYNLANISLGLILLEANGIAAGPVEKSILSSVVFAGAIAGQLSFGYIGDCLGRGPAMQLTMALSIAGALVSGLVAGNGRAALFTQLYGARFVLGVGVGGVYPLAATVAAESTAGHGDKHGGRTKSLVFSFQGVGQILVPIVALGVWHGLAKTQGQGTGGNLAWRALLGFGCLPGLLIAPFKVVSSAKPPQKQDPNNGGPKSGGRKPKRKASLAATLRRDWRSLLPLLAGTAGTWFLFDVTFYANALFAPAVLSAIFDPDHPGHSHGYGQSLSEGLAALGDHGWPRNATGDWSASFELAGEESSSGGRLLSGEAGSGGSVDEACLRTLTIIAIGLPGYLMSILFMDSLGMKKVQCLGFSMLALLYAVLGFLWGKPGDPRLLFLVYGLTFFFSNFGPNTTTFILPASTFPAEIRSSMNGVCAACGKLGALVGSSAFPIAVEAMGYTAVFFACSTIALLGLVATLLFVPNSDAAEGEFQGEAQGKFQDKFQGRAQGKAQGKHRDARPGARRREKVPGRKRHQYRLGIQGY